MVKQRPPLSEAELKELAITYVARYLTSEFKLTQYLRRKLRERGWAGDDPPPLDAIVAWCVSQRFVDDSSFAEAKAGSLARRGYGARRIKGALKAAGIADGLAMDASAQGEMAARATAMAYAKRRRIGPFATIAADDARRRKWMAALVNAGHDFALAKEIANAETPENL